MLTIKQPTHNSYRSVHDLPTPPSTAQISPSLRSGDGDVPHQTQPFVPRNQSPSSSQPMSGPHRGLPPPAAMTLAQQAPPLGPPQPSPQPQPQAQQHSQASPSGPVGTLPPHSHPLSTQQLPPPPPWQHGGDDTMRAWLAAKAEEEKRRAEEERTRQESLRLEQRRTEHDMLRTSLSGGIPPPMVPVVFAGMAGGNLPQAALEWAHHIMFPHGPPPPLPPPPHHIQQQHQPHSQLLLAGSGAGPSSAETQHPDPQAQQQQQPQPPPPPPPPPPQHQQQQQQQQQYGPYRGSSREGGGSAPGSSQTGSFLSANPSSPSRPRAYSVQVSSTRLEEGGGGGGSSGGPNLPNINTNVPQGGFGQQQLDLQASSPIHFHHWQPPSQGQGSSQTSAPVSESPKKRKATGPQPAAPPPSSQQRFRSPPFSHSAGVISNPPPGRRRGHARQRSDLSSYRGPGRGGYGGGGGGRAPSRGMSPSPYSSAPPSATGSLREGEEGAGPSRSQQQQQQPPPSQPRGGGGHPVSSLLSEDPPSGPPYGSGPREPERGSRGRSERRRSPRGPADEKGGGPAGPAGAPGGSD